MSLLFPARQNAHSAGRVKVTAADCSVDMPAGRQSPNPTMFRPGLLVSVSLGRFLAGHSPHPAPRTGLFHPYPQSHRIAAACIGLQQGTAAECLVNLGQSFLGSSLHM